MYIKTLRCAHIITYTTLCKGDMLRHSVCVSMCLSVWHTRALCQNG